MKRISWIAAIAVLALPVANAAADTRYASATGGGAACTLAAPCNLKTAIDPGVPPGQGVVGDIADGDTVVLLGTAGDFVPQNLRFTVDHAITIRGEPGQPRPTIVSAPTGFQPAPLFDVTAPGAILEHLRIEAIGPQARVVHLKPEAAPSTVRDVYLEGDDLDSSGPLMQVEGASTVERAEIARFGNVALTNGETLHTVGDVLLRDSFIRHRGAGAAAENAIRTLGPSTSTRLRNVTVASDDHAIFGVVGAQVDIRNSLFDGTVGDIAAAGTVTYTVTHSNYDPAQVSATAGAVIIEAPPNQDQTAGFFPAMADPLNGDFRQLGGSPTINAGSTDAFTGATDIDGEPRVMGAAIDIGGDEFPPAPPPGGTPIPQPPASPKKKCRKGFKLKRVKKKGKKAKRKCVRKKRKKRRR
jgi:hypothetical protein